MINRNEIATDRAWAKVENLAEKIDAFAERVVDSVWNGANSCASVITGRPTRVEKVVRTGPRIGGVIRPDIHIPQNVKSGEFIGIIQPGRYIGVSRLYQFYVQESHAREVRRNIVFTDAPKS